jgi:ComF family protein
VHDLKYHARLQLAPWFARTLARLPPDPPHLVMAVPLHFSRLAERGFNQAHEVARSIALDWNVPLMSTAVRRTRRTAVQASLSPKERLGNVRGAFACSVSLRGRSVLVVDDVMTTGATLDAFAHVLKEAGAARVTNLVIARTLAPAPSAS